MQTETIHRESDGTLPSYAWPGAYNLRYLMEDGESICAECANGGNGSLATTDKAACEDSNGAGSGWLIVAQYVNWEGPDDYCAHCGKVMPSEYGDPDSESESD